MRSATLLAFVAAAMSVCASPILNARTSTFVLPTIESLKFSAEDAESLSAHVASLPEQRLIRTSSEEDAFTITEGEKALLTASGVNFKDVTDYPEEHTVASQRMLKRQFAKETYPSGPVHTASTISGLVATASTAQLSTFTDGITSFTNRYYRSSFGKQSSAWILSQVKTMASSSSRASAITVKEFTHSWGQNSVIARVNPAGTANGVIILGAHQDSINQASPTNGRAPGADDDGSGSVVLMSIFNAISKTGYVPKDFALEFHWYSGEEGGLLGSAAISKSYASAGTRVRAMFNLDMTAYTKPGTTASVEFVTDYDDDALTKFTMALVPVYTKYQATTQVCGYACSDHASWTDAGYQSTFPFEGHVDNPTIHSSGDLTTVSGFSHAQSLEFVKLGLGFIAELAGAP